MTQDARRKEIIRLLQDNVNLETNKLACDFGVSAVTIRRDFDFLERQGLITTTYGGAIVNKTLPDIVDTEGSADEHKRIAEKRAIARKAAELIKPGDTVLLDAGSTVKELAIELLAKKDITVLTNSILVINVLSQGKGISVISLPGTFKRSSMCFFGTTTVDFLNFVHVDYAFIGCSAISYEHGCTIHDPDEALVKRQMSRVAERSVVLADHWKLGTSSTYTALPLNEMDMLITGNTESKQLSLIQESGVEVITVDAK